MNNNRIYLSSPHMGGLEKEYIKQAFDTNWIAPLGKNVDEFEREALDYVKSKGALALSSGTSAIHLALKLLSVSEGDYVFCSDLTFAASCNPIVYEKGIPIFIDSEKDSWNMSYKALEKAFDFAKEKNKLPKAVIVVHLYGQAADMDNIKRICDEYKVPIIEDAAESLGATYKGTMTGTIGKYGVYSFNGNKIITTSGGGMLISEDVESINKARFLATQARENKPYYHHKELGYNYRLSNILAGIGRGQLRVLEDRIKKKKDIFYRYLEGFKELKEISMMPIREYGSPNFWLSCITINDTCKVTPKNIIDELNHENIEARHIWKPMHMQPLYKECSFFKEGDEAISEEIFKMGVCLPSDTKMTEEEQEKVISLVRRVIIKEEI